MSYPITSYASYLSVCFLWYVCRERLKDHFANLMRSYICTQMILYTRLSSWRLVADATTLHLFWCVKALQVAMIVLAIENARYKEWEKQNDVGLMEAPQSDWLAINRLIWMATRRGEDAIKSVKRRRLDSHSDISNWGAIRTYGEVGLPVETTLQLPQFHMDLSSSPMMDTKNDISEPKHHETYLIEDSPSSRTSTQPAHNGAIKWPR